MELKMRISVVICTFGRAAVLRNLLDSLEIQTCQNFETLVVDGNDEPSPARSVVHAFLQRPGNTFRVDLIPSKRGLAHQRNVGIESATGELICFLDDDVTLPGDFLSQVAAIFGRADMHDVGGLTGYDDQNYPVPVTLRWRLRRALRVIPNLPPGGVDRLGRGIPLSFLEPFKGFKEVGLLPGFCMIFRRCAVAEMRFDELIPTYAGEDRDFSMRVGWRSRLLICGDLRLRHHAVLQGRDSDLKRNFQSGFGMGRRFAKYSRGGWDNFQLITTFLGDFAIDLLFLVSHPGKSSLRTTITRIDGFFAGLRSEKSIGGYNRLPSKVSSPEQRRQSASTVR
jgi:glycosyltransferase involved in cell wall biosynthesis